MHVAIIDYGSGNLHSAAKAFERAAGEHRDQGRRVLVRQRLDPQRAPELLDHVALEPGGCVGTGGGQSPGVCGTELGFENVVEET